MTTRDMLLGVLVTAIWGFNFSVIKMGLSAMDPFMLAGCRFLLCAVPLIFFVARPDTAFKYVIAYGLLFGVGLWGMVALGIYFGASAGVASLVLQISVFITILFGRILFKETITRGQKIGAAIALVGLALIISITDGSVTLGGLLLVLLGALCWSLSNSLLKWSGAKRIFPFIVWSSLFSPLPLFVLSYWVYGDNQVDYLLQSFNFKSVFSILFQVYPTTLFGYWIWNSLLRRYPVSSVAPLSLLVPLFGLLGSSIFYGETIGTTKAVACVLIVCGLAINLLPKAFPFFSRKPI